ncbi:MAG: hypothetical protein MSA39_10030 [Prevotella sp.]|nr:hypothetical protein [Prevotella sp.]
MEKPLVIKVKAASIPNGTPGKWEDLSGNIEQFTADIETPAIDENSDISAQVSGIPTAYARANLFKSALQSYGKSKESVDLNLNTFYQMLSSEWRGFIACIALDYSRMKTERVDLVYSDGKDTKDTSNIYEPKGTFGNMLFHRKPLWCLKDEDTDEAHRGIPFIDIIKYDGKVVGATSPECLLFTSCAYKIEDTENRAWVDYKTGKFKDPLESSDLDLTQTLQLYAYISYLIEGLNNDGMLGINGLTAYYSYLDYNLAPKYDNILSNLTQWRKEIEAYAVKKNFKLEAASVPPINLFNAPFDIAFNFKDELYGMDGVLYSTAQENGVLFNPKELLLPDTAKIARLIFKGPKKNEPSEFPIYVLAADKKNEPGEKAYFALPLSPLGIKAFGKNIGALVEPLTTRANVPSRLTAIYDPDSEKNNLEVILHLVLNDGRTKEMKATYTCGGEIDGRNLIMWPNFISKKWHRYFMYSELPHNVNLKDYSFQALPFVGDEQNDFEIINYEDGQPLYLAKDGHDVDYDFTDKNGNERHVETSLHIVCNSGTADNPYKYEIYECNHPFKGIKLNLPDTTESGFLLIKYTTTTENPCIAQDKLGIQDSNLRGTTLGIDFGSTNTSVAYLDPLDQQAKGITFTNRRISLLRAGEEDNDKVANEDHLFFFQSNPILSNAIKSTLTIHDSRRVTKDINETMEISKFEKEVKGGFPCFSRNLPLANVEANKRVIVLKTAECGEVNQIYNMKWDDDERNIAYKKAFLRSLLLQVYAELFCKDLFPRKLKWSYPSSMSASLLRNYNTIWSSLPAVNPLNDVNNHANVPIDENYQLKVSTFGYNLQAASTSNDGAKKIGGGNMFMAGSGNMFMTKPKTEQPQGFTANNSFMGKSNNAPLDGNEKKNVAFEKDDDTKQFSFNPVKMVDENDFQSMTEASAVANFLNVQADDRDALTICFDIGGSTSDISALCQLQTGEGARLTMIKQNSIHFAAQLVGEATRYCNSFQRVLLSTCEEFGLRIQGLNLGENRYNKDTASYYFEQMVDRLTPEQLPFFYKKISSDCSELMCADIYVTGLITYYAGLLARKLVKQVRNSTECRWTGDKKPNVLITFAGKGARIMEWLSTATNDDLANQFYQAMFLKGLGESDYGDFISGLNIAFPRTITNNVKFEVSKGLAMESTTLMRPQDSDPIEVIGEEGFTIEDANGNNVLLDADNSISPEMMASLGDKFYGSSSAGPRFQDFLNLFYQVTQEFFGMKMNPSVVSNALQNMGLLSYIRDTPEYLHARRAEQFDFVSPILILEGSKFYKDLLLKNIGND